VGFVDVIASLFSLAGVPLPEHYHGRAFAGEQKAPPRGHIFLFRGRMDERYDTVRAIRESQFRYLRNYSPHRPWGQHYSYPFQVLPSMRSWHEEFTAGRCNPVQAAYWQEKPSEELYEIASDPFEIKNLAGELQHAERLAAMRRTLREEMIAMRDTGFIPEGMFEHLAGEKTIYEYAQSEAYPIERIIDVADRATSRDPAALPELMAALNDEHPVVRYWGATGCLVLQQKAAPAQEKLLELLQDDFADVRISAAEALGYLGRTDAALDTLAAVLQTGNPYEVLAALNALDFMHAAGNASLDQVQAMLKGRKFPEPSSRIAEYLLSQQP
jgi:hypothetical protein